MQAYDTVKNQYLNKLKQPLDVKKYILRCSG